LKGKFNDDLGEELPHGILEAADTILSAVEVVMRNAWYALEGQKHIAYAQIYHHFVLFELEYESEHSLEDQPELGLLKDFFVGKHVGKRVIVILCEDGCALVG
jgi:hypothetical protein